MRNVHHVFTAQGKAIEMTLELLFGIVVAGVLICAAPVVLRLVVWVCIGFVLTPVMIFSKIRESCSRIRAFPGRWGNRRCARPMKVRSRSEVQARACEASVFVFPNDAARPSTARSREETAEGAKTH